MMSAGVLTFQEFAMSEQLPLATIQSAVLEVLRGRTDIVLFGAQAVNAWVGEPRMAQNIDILSSRAEAVAAEIRSYLAERFQVAMRVREVKAGIGYRVYQLQKSGNRHLVDIRSVSVLPASETIEQILVLAPIELIAYKLIAYHQRQGKPKAGTDWRDLAMLLLKFPELKVDPGPVTTCLEIAEVGPGVFSIWRDFVRQDLVAVEEGDDF
jgi:hypothetical protein